MVAEGIFGAKASNEASVTTRTPTTRATSNLNTLVAVVGISTLVSSWSARADVPVSAGTTGALQRSTIAAAGPGSEHPEFDPIQDPEPGRLSFHFRFPFFQFGDIDKAGDVI